MLKNIINLPKFEVNIWENGDIRGLILCRNLTFKEAKYIFNRLAFLSKEDEYEDPKECEKYKRELITDITDLITGEGYVYNLVNKYDPGSAIENITNIWDSLDIIQYLISSNAIAYK